MFQKSYIKQYLYNIINFQLLWEITNGNTAIPKGYWGTYPCNLQRTPLFRGNILIWECKCEVNQGIKCRTTDSRLSSTVLQYHFNFDYLRHEKKSPQVCILNFQLLQVTHLYSHILNRLNRTTKPATSIKCNLSWPSIASEEVLLTTTATSKMKQRQRSH